MYKRQGIDKLNDLPKLFRLNICWTKVNGKHLGGLASSSLQYFDAKDCAIKSLGKGAFKKLPNLRRIVLAGNPLGDNGIQQLACCSKVEQLVLSDTKLSDSGLAQLGSLSKLKGLYLEGSNIEGKAFEVFERSKVLRVVATQKTNLTAAGLESLSRIKSLTHLMIDDSPEMLAGIEHFVGHKKIERINVEGNKSMKKFQKVFQAIHDAQPKGKRCMNVV